MPYSVDTLTIDIGASASSAIEQIGKLEGALARLKTSVSGGAGLGTVAKQMQTLASAANSVTTQGLGNLKGLANALRAFQGLDSAKLSSSFGTQIGKIADSVSRLPSDAASRLSELAGGLRPLGELGRASLTSFITQLGKLPGVVSELDKVDIGKFARQMKSAASAIAPLANEMNKVAAGFSAFPSRIQRLIQSNTGLASSNKAAAKSFGVLGTGVSSTTAKFGVYTVAFRRLASVMGGWVQKSNDYVENLNLFRVAMGDGAESALEYAEAVNEAVGIDTSEWIRNQGLFKQITSGFGVASESADLMSKNLTQLAYDISSFYNIGTEEAMTKLQSAISGELEPVRRLGYAIDVATLQQVAYTHGIEQSVDTMNQAQKSQLRYVALMEQSGNVINDFSRTVQTPANALRILNQQTTQLARALGNLLIPFLQQIIPWVQAFVEMLTDAIQRLATLVGFTLPTIDYSGVGGLTSGAEDAEEALAGAAGAAKDLKKATIGIDELNIISPPSSGGGGADTPLGGDLGIELPEYDFLKGLSGDLTNVRDRLKEILVDYVLPIAAGLAAWKIAASLPTDIGALGATLASLAVGVGVTLVVDSVEDIIFGEGLTWESILKGGAGGAFAGGGLGAMLATRLGLTWQGGVIRGAAIGLGITLFVESIIGTIKDGITWESLVSSGAGGAALGVALAKKLGLSWAKSGLAGGLLTLSLTLLVDAITSSVKDGVTWETVLEGTAGGVGVGAALAKALGLTVGKGGLIGGTVAMTVTLLADIINFEMSASGGNDTFGSALKKLLVDIGGGVVGFIAGGPAGALLGLLFTLAPQIVLPNLDSIKQGFSDWWNDFKEHIASEWNPDRWFDPTMWINVGVAIVDGILSGIWQAVKGIIDWIHNNLVMPIVNAVKDLLGIHSPSTVFAEIGTEIINGLLQGISNTWHTVVDFFTVSLPAWWNNSLLPWFTLEKWTGLVANILPSFSTAWGSVTEFFTTALPLWWSENVAPWFTLEKWGGIASNIGASIKSAWNATVGDWAKDVSNWWETGVKPWFTLDKWKGLTHSITTAIKNVWSETVVQWAGDISAWWTEDVEPWFTWDKWKQLGSDALEGLFGGLANIGNKIATWGGNLVAGVKNFFGIASPSKLFRDEIGVNMGLGVAEGLESTAGDVLAAAQGIGESIMKSFGGVEYDPGVDYMALINEAVAAGDTEEAARLERLRNAKIAGEGLDYAQTFDFQGLSAALEDELEIMRGDAASFFTGLRTDTSEYTHYYVYTLAEIENALFRFADAFEARYKQMAAQSNAAIQSIVAYLNSIPREIVTVHRIVTEQTTVAAEAVDAYAAGGFPTSGQMFLAREAGPELVGTIGGQTAVANNDQIEAGIEEAAYRGFVRAMASQKQSQQPYVIENKVYLDRKQLRASLQQADRESGASIMTGGVMT